MPTKAKKKTQNSLFDTEEQGKAGTAVYDESKIKTLGSLEHIRLRSGMYIGRIGDGSNLNDGVYILIKEIIDNSIDEYIMGYGKQIRILYDKKSRMLSIRDYGRGIPFGKLIECVSVINTGAKYNNEVFQFSVGLNGVGTKAVNALSSHFKVCSFRDKRYASAVFSQGKRIKETKGSTEEKDGTYVEFIPDAEIFQTYTIDLDILASRIWNYAYLNPKLTLTLNGETHISQKGLVDLLEQEVGDKSLYPVLGIRDSQLEFSFTHTHSENLLSFSFVNGQYTADGGTHQSAFLEGLLRGINGFYNKNYNSGDLREGLVSAISIKLENPIFESQTKNKLGNTEIRQGIVKQVHDCVVDLLFRNTGVAKVVAEKLEQNQKLRRELLSVRKEAREAAKKVSLKVPNFRDCKYHRDHAEHGPATVIFITEGHSATGSMIPSRNVYNQAVFSLRGKLSNMVQGDRRKIYKDSELYNLMVALGIESNSDDLRFEKIIIATDADFDGFHIRNLIITFFLTFFESLVVKEHLYILETPLFRVRNKTSLRYCYSKEERDVAMRDIAHAEVTRFKGLGEISPHEFGQFIGKDMKLESVRVKKIKDIPNLLQFYMGKNTDERREFMKEHLL
ncbi:DNA topoisomerase 4 subunit B-like [Ylistrum balloti]|uniref:DNA topoisomerase 4 subunit B-like n=1 Tax=Ylistrum balloti TaxID=509963 RepID=UPI002905F1A6|nr:DNA topoisomerase 4 subunit B-like [Ylistrum balloti]